MPWFAYDRATEVMASNLDELFPQRAALKGPQLISFDLDKFFVSQVENHYQDMAAIKDGWPFEALVCDGALYAELLVAESLHLPVFAVGLTMVMPDAHGPPPFFGLMPARTLLGRLRHAVVRKMLASGMRVGTIHYNEILARHGVAPIGSDGFPHEPMLRTQRVSLNGSPGLEFPGYQPLPNAEYVGPLVPARRALSASAPLPDVVVDPTAKVVAVSQGTVDNTDPAKLIIPTIEALKDSGDVVVATTAGAQTAALRARYPQPNVVIADFINYDDLSPHVDVFVTSGGFGSNLAAFLHGLPVVGAGKREGKDDINARIGYNNLGIDLRSEHPKPAAIHKAVRRLLDDPTYARKVADLRAELQSYDPIGTIEKRLLQEM
ncbi:nucleotide disphospho-sugar-binding domain-containing protein [Lapillicoccus sp.]|uniref:glycosyltransferase n=1 Tax=Lapillicoccus sp. TaxID=1909287 RepID=UPI0025F8010D|nr:nucleotide disphospho-sugar-binding domain-containing protein [Lapillicoccus sp.]